MAKSTMTRRNRRKMCQSFMLVRPVPRVESTTNDEQRTYRRGSSHSNGGRQRSGSSASLRQKKASPVPRRRVNVLPPSVALADLDGDGKLEVRAADSSTGTLFCLDAAGE